MFTVRLRRSGSSTSRPTSLPAAQRVFILPSPFSARAGTFGPSRGTSTSGPINRPQCSAALHIAQLRIRGHPQALGHPGSQEPKADGANNPVEVVDNDTHIVVAPRGIRSSFRDSAAVETTHPREVIEAASGIVVQNKAKAA